MLPVLVTSVVPSVSVLLVTCFHPWLNLVNRAQTNFHRLSRALYILTYGLHPVLTPILSRENATH